MADETNSTESAASIMDQFLKTMQEQKLEQEQDPEWQKNNLEWVLRNDKNIATKVQNDDEYAQHLYATLCNNEFLPPDIWRVLKDETWSCSWRYAGGIIADIQNAGDYMSWYCSGNEGQVFPEIEQDLNHLGWRIVQ